MATELPHTSRDEEQAYERLSPFELKDRLSALAEQHDPGATLRAGRGNPNWVSTTPRQAFFLLGRFALDEARRTWDEPGLGGMPSRPGIAGRLDAFLAEQAPDPGASFLAGAVAHGVAVLGFDADAWVHELVDAVLGDNYPEPDRMLRHVEQVVRAFLDVQMFAGEPPDGPPIELFATEGGTAAMCYVFDTLVANRLLHPGDRIALAVPVFTPYIEIPRLPRYDFEVVPIFACEHDGEGLSTWQYPDVEIDKLADPSIRCLFMVNPSNPASVMVRGESMARIAEVVRERNPDLIVVTDDVYCTFVPGFRSIMAELPRNTINVYSFSKHFGATGWRLGTIAVHPDNVMDRLLAALPEVDKAVLDRRYASIALEPRSLRFIDRLVADSRHVALNHTAGLSTPQQVQMALFALASLLDVDEAFTGRVRARLAARLARLCAGTGVPVTPNPLSAGYYVEIDLLEWARRVGGAPFVDHLLAGYEPVDPVFRLAEQRSVVLLSGAGFDAPGWSVRVSLANLPDDAYEEIGRSLAVVLEEYVEEFTAAGGTVSPSR